MGSRLRPLSIAVPKELLPVGEKPAVHYAVEDLVSGSVRRIVVVINKSKSRIKDYLREVFPEVSFTFVFQEDPKGLGFALLESKRWLDDGPFVLLLPDNIFFGMEPLSVSLIRAHTRTGKSCVALFGIGKFKAGARVGLEVVPDAAGLHSVTAMHFLDTAGPAPGIFFGPAAMLFTPEIFPHLESNHAHWDFSRGDYTERPALEGLISAGGLTAAWVEGQCFDVGTLAGYKDCLRFLFSER
jgi:UTP--glucose-1-phosphate uridylyltransferase